jgi:menaquinone-specific isochorismate synthase
MTDIHTATLGSEIALALRKKHAALPPGKVARVEVEVPTQTDLIAWLSAQKQAPRLGYWRDRDDGSEIAACGVSDVVRAPTWHEMESGVTGVTRRLAQATDGVRYFGGLRFEAERGGDAVWDGWGGCEFGLPACGIEKNARGALFFAQAVAGSEKSLHAALHFISSLSTHIRAQQQASAEELTVTPLPSRAEWEKTVAAALAEIASGALQKIVLARREHITWSAPRCPFSVLATLRSWEPHCYCYAAFGSESVFLGASPELLYHRDDATLCTEAVAGTAGVSGSADNDTKAARSLASSEKNLREHNIVRDWIKEKLSPLSVAAPQPAELHIRTLHSVQHLVTPITARLRDDTTDAALLRVLHPTPAVAGRPRDAALHWIARHEPFERGWYAAPVGWISPRGAKFIVALRCAMLRKNEAYLYSGAGIVSGSDPAQEWDELDNKTATLRKAIGECRP